MKKQKGEITTGFAVVVFSAFLGMLADGTIKPVSGHDLNCQVETVKSENGNYSYASTAHCLKK